MSNPRGERGSQLLRVLDRYVGIPCVWLLGLVHRKRDVPRDVRSIGLLKTAAIGDTVLLTASVLDLRAAFPDARIVLITGGDNFAFGRLVPSVDAVVKLPIRKPWALFGTIRKHRFDVILDFGQWPRIDAVVAALAIARFKAGFRTDGQFRHYPYDATVPHSNSCHELENFRSLVRTLRIAADHEPRIVLPSPAMRPAGRAAEWGDYIILHLWPGGVKSYLKEWPIKRWGQLAGAFVGEGNRIVLTGAPSDAPRNEAFIASLDSAVGPAMVNAAGCNIEETAVLLDGARLVVSVNTGVMHMAAAIGVPLVGLHGPTSSRRWGPLGPRSVAVEAPLCGCGYLDLGFEYRDKLRCMESISLEQVRDACGRALALGRERSVEAERA